MIRPLDAYLQTRRTEIEAALLAWLPSPPGTPQVVADAMRYSVEAGGKRLRPILCLAAAETVAIATGTDATVARRLALPAACAIEMIHTYSLVHDDLPAMDNDTLRRGLPTLHVVAGEGMAILAGDGLLTEAFALLARDGVVWTGPWSGVCAGVGNGDRAGQGDGEGADDGARLHRRLKTIGVIATAAGASGMVGGQALDLDALPRPAMPGLERPAPPALDAEGLRVMHAKKTGALITASAVAGAIMAGASPAAEAAIREAGQQFGLAFQIVDDILDVEGSSAHLGKTAGKDAAAGKPTYPALYGLAVSRRMAQDCVEAAGMSLRAAGLADTRLIDIGRWIVDRSN
ncbi:MAG: polyprenyl synthetase family protein [Vicinamibacterales bacterium]